MTYRESPGPKEILNTEEAAELLGFRPYTMREKARKGEIPARKVGGVWRFSRRDLLAIVKGAVDNVWRKARKTAIAEFREATEEDEDMIRRREGETILRSFGIGLDQSAWPHYLIMRGSHGEEYPIARFSFRQTYEVVDG